MLEDKKVEVRMSSIESLLLIFEILKKRVEEEGGGKNEEELEFDLEGYENFFDLEEIMKRIEIQNSKIEFYFQKKLKRMKRSLKTQLKESITKVVEEDGRILKLEGWVDFLNWKFFNEFFGRFFFLL